MAKVAASYHNLNGGTAAWALQALTGDYCCVFMLDGKVRHVPYGYAVHWFRRTMCCATATKRVMCVLARVQYGGNRGAGSAGDPMALRWLRAELAARPADKVVAFGGGKSPVGKWVAGVGCTGRFGHVPSSPGTHALCPLLRIQPARACIASACAA